MLSRCLSFDPNQLFTEVPLDQIEELSKLEGADINKAKVILADEATKYVRATAHHPLSLHLPTLPYPTLTQINLYAWWWWVAFAFGCDRLLHGEACLAEIHATVSSLFAKGDATSTAGTYLHIQKDARSEGID